MFLRHLMMLLRLPAHLRMMIQMAMVLMIHGDLVFVMRCLIMLDMDGICGSSGSACTSGSLDPSHVLLAIGLPHEIAHGSLRLTLNDEITKDQIDYTVESIKKIVERLRSMSPLYEDFVKHQR